MNVTSLWSHLSKICHHAVTVYVMNIVKEALIPPTNLKVVCKLSMREGHRKVKPIPLCCLGDN